MSQQSRPQVTRQVSQQHDFTCLRWVNSRTYTDLRWGSNMTFTDLRWSDRWVNNMTYTGLGWVNNMTYTDLMWFNNMTCTDLRWFNNMTCTDLTWSDRWVNNMTCTDGATGESKPKMLGVEGISLFHFNFSSDGCLVLLRERGWGIWATQSGGTGNQGRWSGVHYKVRPFEVRVGLREVVFVFSRHAFWQRHSPLPECTTLLSLHGELCLLVHHYKLMNHRLAKVLPHSSWVGKWCCMLQGRVFVSAGRPETCLLSLVLADQPVLQMVHSQYQPLASRAL